jgi:alkylation response protein AidB-like acyl-CoA dehydrogenase
MTTYRAPIDELKFALRQIAEIGELRELPAFSELSDDLVDAILEEAGRFYAEVVAPGNRAADRQGASLENRAVVPPPALDGIYQAYREGGWPSLTGNPEYGGQGLPHMLGFAVDEMMQSANMAFSLLPLLTQGVITALGRYGSDSQKALYLPRLISGEWAGTMNLTEPDAGSDLAAVKTSASPQGDHYLLRGQKIFITWGDQPYTDNIVHLVLARTPDAPAGTRGISLFIVPKFLVDDSGTPGRRNDVYPVGVEHKLGIHASPTCTMAFGDDEGAVGYLVGEENQGLKYMFAMMNHARLAVGLQGVAIAERARQQAAAYARERVQGRPPECDQGAAIIRHPDVRRMLGVMKVLTQGGRALTSVAMYHFDHAVHGETDVERPYHQDRVDLLTPLVKGWCTEMANEVTSLGIQVHGGTGYIEETGAAQHYRDARIAAIYEGTNGIQAMDLMGRKLLADRGEVADAVLDEMAEIPLACRAQGLDDLAEHVEAALTRSRKALFHCLGETGRSPAFAGAVAFSMLMLLGTTFAAAWLAKGAARSAHLMGGNGDSPDFHNSRILWARVFAEQVLPRTEAWFAAVVAGEEALMTLPDEEF